MSLISASELAQIQSIATSGMTSTCTIQRRTTVQTANGQESEWTTLSTGVSCWIKELTPISGTLGAIAGAVGLSEQFSIRLPVGTDVLGGDQIVSGGKTYTVESTDADDSYPVWVDCACRMIE